MPYIYPVVPILYFIYKTNSVLERFVWDIKISSTLNKYIFCFKNQIVLQENK